MWRQSVCPDHLPDRLGLDGYSLDGNSLDGYRLYRDRLHRHGLRGGRLDGDWLHRDGLDCHRLIVILLINFIVLLPSPLPRFARVQNLNNVDVFFWF